MTKSKVVPFIIKDTETSLKVGDTLKELRNFPLRMEELFGKIKLQLLEGKHIFGQIATIGTEADLLESGREAIGDSVTLLVVKERGGIKKITLSRMKEGTSYYRRWLEMKNIREPIGVIDGPRDIVYLALLKACFEEGQLKQAVVGVELDHFTIDNMIDFQDKISKLAR